MRRRQHLDWPPTRRVSASAIVGYAGRLSRLAERARRRDARPAGDPDAVAQAVIDAARAALDLRDGLRAGVRALIRALVQAAVPDADRRACGHQLDDVERRRSSAMRGELEAVVTLRRPARGGCRPIHGLPSTIMVDAIAAAVAKTAQPWRGHPDHRPRAR